MRPLPIVAAAILLTSSLLVSGVAAATLGGVTSASLSSTVVAVTTGAPVVSAWENFDAANNSAISGTTTDGGGLSWATPTCTWRVQSNLASTSTSSQCQALLNSSATNRAVEATVTRGANTWDAGLTIESNSAATQFLTAEWTSTANGSVELWKYTGTWTQLAGVTGLYASPSAGPASTVLRLALTSAHVVQGSINGAVVVSTTLSATDQTTFENAAHQYDGIFAFQTTAARWDDFHLQSTT